MRLMTKEDWTNSTTFPQTRWSLVQAAGEGGEEQRQEALQSLCGTYWFPLYAYARRRGLDVEDAQDVTQDFFEHLLEAHVLERLTGPERGRLRSYLLKGLQSWIFKQHRERTAAKRGGGRVLSFDALDAEENYRNEPVEHETPESLYERQWALKVLDLAFTRLREDYVSVGKGELAETLIPLLGRTVNMSMMELGQRIGVSEGHARVLLHRMRKHFRAALSEVIRETTDGTDVVVAEETAHLQAVLAR